MKKPTTFLKGLGFVDSVRSSVFVSKKQYKETCLLVEVATREDKRNIFGKG